MNKKQAKSLLAYVAVSALIIVASLILVKAGITFSSGDSDLAISYNLVTEAKADRAYTPQCLTDCHLPFCITSSGNSATSGISLTENDITQSLNYAQGSDQSVLKEIGVDYLTTETYSIDVPVIGTCQDEILNNETGEYETYPVQCVTGYTQEQRTREVWKPLKDIPPLNLEAGKEQCFDIWGKLEPKLNVNFAVDVIPHITLQNKEFSLDEYAWWNVSVTYKRRHVGNYSLYSSNLNVTNFTCLINSASGFNDSNVYNYVWGKCDYNDTYFYYNNYSDFYFINGTENTQLAMQTEGKTGRYNYNPDSVWDNFTLVILPNESSSSNNNTGNIIALGSLKDNITFSNNVTKGALHNPVTGLISITPLSYVRTGLNASGGPTYSGMRTSQNISYKCSSCTFEAIFKYPGYNPATQNGEFLAWWSTGNKIRRFQLIANNNFDSAASNSSPCSWTTGFETGKWYYLALVFDNSSAGKENISLFVGTANGSSGWKPNCSVAPEPYNFTNLNGIYFGGNPADTSGSFNGTWDMITLSNVARSKEWVEGRYQNIMLNYSFLGAEQSNITTNANETSGDDAILQGILNSTINSSYTTYSSQQAYSRNITGSQTLGRFDYLAVSGNQRWAFNYVSSSEPTSNFTYMVNITPSLYVWEATNLTYDAIRQQVTQLINSTKI